MKIPKATQLPSGSWRVRVRANGQYISITRQTEKEAVAEAMALKAGIKESRNRAPKDMTLREAIDQYIDLREAALSPATIRGYTKIRDFRFPDVMDRTINKTTDAMYQRAINRQSMTHAPKTVKNAWAFVSTVLKTIANRNVTCSLPQVVSKERLWLEPEDIQIFTRAIIGHKHEIPMLLALHGLRASEIFDLEWNDIDTKKKTIRVFGSAVMDKNDERVHKNTNKNSSSRRMVPILIDQLAERVESDEKKNEYICSLSLSGLYRAINAVCRKVELPEVGIHGLRHSFASLCFHLGIPEEMTMQFGGWNDYTTMKKIYTHLAQKDKLSHTEALQGFFNLNR